MEIPTPIEILKAPVAIAQFIGERLLGGGWSDLPHGEPAQARRPVRANITYFTTGGDEL